ncbi:alpha/beta hydrolase [Flavobacterium reichenbachii]|uniref:Alpha/beta hydrolase n=1 Tax=Flavobacterium reichenbachii TaxID=362418 RepID=A0A085ZKC6_9FLAO|nr:alpha/beta hydrolase [Flavobacterium reichenbachii]KFF04890.1 alpha/beta hydrolase [Flavobacterium reichenbachii]OXB12124.1 alpha/beta hydrolase [Flavobacterium reichenbachii]
MKSFLICLFLALSFSATAQNLYSKSYGDKKNIAVVFIHGGPSGNSTLFEGTTAQKLAENGFYVIVYDRRGEGRSADNDAKFTYEEAFQDLNSIYKKYHLKKAVLIGHSFGGLVSTLYTHKYPKNVSALVLAGALFAQQETYDHILNSIKKIHDGDSKTLNKIAYIEKLDKNSAGYRKYCFELASDENYFKMPKPTKASKKLYAKYESGEFFKTNIRNKNAPLVFYKNEKQNNIDSRPLLKKIKTSGVPIFAIYGKNDGIFSPEQMGSIEQITGKNNFALLDNCSHYLFVDQQDKFISKIKNWIK